MTLGPVSDSVITSINKSARVRVPVPKKSFAIGVSDHPFDTAFERIDTVFRRSCVVCIVSYVYIHMREVVQHLTYFCPFCAGTVMVETGLFFDGVSETTFTEEDQVSGGRN